MTPETFEETRDRWRSELVPERYNRPKCPAYEGAMVPHNGRQLLSWARCVQDGYRLGYVGPFAAMIGAEARRRGWGGQFYAFNPKKTAVLYQWAMAELKAIDEAEAKTEAVWGPCKREVIRRPR